VIRRNTQILTDVLFEFLKAVDDEFIHDDCVDN
jgi:hypothetical protein